MSSYATHEPGQMSLRQRRQFRQDPEALRQLLPLKQYLFLLHQAATTGWLPKLNGFGRPIPVSQNDVHQCLVQPKERLACLQYLTDKAMPDVKADTIEKKTNSDLLAAAPSDARYLTTASLHAAANAGDHDGEPREVQAEEIEPSAEELFDVPRANPRSA